MRVFTVVGVALILGGTALLWKRPTYSTRHDVVEIGEFKASLRERETIPLWIGAVLIAGGVGCLLASQRRPK
jgi:drug/metabolite transporter (DMT)-like permease